MGGGQREVLACADHGVAPRPRGLREEAAEDEAPRLVPHDEAYQRQEEPQVLRMRMTWLARTVTCQSCSDCAPSLSPRIRVRATGVVQRDLRRFYDMLRAVS